MMIKKGCIPMEPLLKVENLKTHFFQNKRVIPAVNGVDFHINKGETVAVVGESGCGKSLSALSIMRLVPQPGGRIVDGSIKMGDIDLTQLTENEMCKIRGKEISMIFQEPMTSLNPVLTIGEQIIEVITYHQMLTRKEAAKKAVQLLEMVGFPRAKEVLSDYPHRLSGGMRQRVMIAIAMSCNPKLLIADEPTTALDVTIQAQIMELLKDLTKKYETSILLITHDLGVVSEMAERVIVMYAGEVVEEALVDDLFDAPYHPYTEGLINSVPTLTGEITRLHAIEGTVPLPGALPKGCRFAPRCSKAFDRCFEEKPELKAPTEHRLVRCFLYENQKGES